GGVHAVAVDAETGRSPQAGEHGTPPVPADRLEPDPAASLPDLRGVEARQAEVGQSVGEAFDDGRLATAGRAGQQQVLGGAVLHGSSLLTRAALRPIPAAGSPRPGWRRGP